MYVLYRSQEASLCSTIHQAFILLIHQETDIGQSHVQYVTQFGTSSNIKH